MQQLPNFMASIDNLSFNVKDARNVMIGPVYSHLKEWEEPGSKRQPIAIFQFINKKDFKAITDYDVVSNRL